MNLEKILSMIREDTTEPNNVVIFSARGSSILYDGVVDDVPDSVDLGCKVNELLRIREVDEVIQGDFYKDYFLIKVD